MIETGDYKPNLILLRKLTKYWEGRDDSGLRIILIVTFETPGILRMPLNILTATL
jgi:hypothetical protein